MRPEFLGFVMLLLPLLLLRLSWVRRGGSAARLRLELLGFVTLLLPLLLLLVVLLVRVIILLVLFCSRRPG